MTKAQQLKRAEQKIEQIRANLQAPKLLPEVRIGLRSQLSYWENRKSELIRGDP